MAVRNGFRTGAILAGVTPLQLGIVLLVCALAFRFFDALARTFLIGYAAAILAIDPNLVDMSKANVEFPPFPPFTVNSGPVHTAFFFTSPGSVYNATRSGTWGDATTATPEMGERFLALGVKSTLAVLENIEKTFAAMPPR